MYLPFFSSFWYPSWNQGNLKPVWIGADRVLQKKHLGLYHGAKMKYPDTQKIGEVFHFSSLFKFMAYFLILLYLGP